MASGIEAMNNYSELQKPYNFNTQPKEWKWFNIELENQYKWHPDQSNCYAYGHYSDLHKKYVILDPSATWINDTRIFRECLKKMD